MTEAFLIYVIVVNLVTAFLSVLDKGFAVYDRRRIPEGLLLTLSFAGGAAGAKLVQILTGHKTLKTDFCASLSLIAFLQLGTAAAVWSETVRAQASGVYERLALFEDSGAEAVRVTPVSEENAMPRRFGPGS